MRTRLVALATLLSGALLGLHPAPARAVAIHEYAGNPFTFVAPSSGYTTSMAVTATLTLNDPCQEG